jgi:hypothetical protein
METSRVGAFLGTLPDSECLETRAELGLAHPMPGDLRLPEEKDGDLQAEPSLEVRITRDVLLLEEDPVAEDPLDLGRHLTAEMAPGFGEEREDRDAQRGFSGEGAPRRLNACTPAAAVTRRIVSWTRSPVRSGWIPIQLTSGKGTGRGGRYPEATRM